MHKAVIAALVILTLSVLGIAVGCAISDPFKQSVGSTLTTVGGQLWIGAQGLWFNLMTLASANGVNFLIYTVISFVFGGVIWVWALHPLWEKRPSFMGGNKADIPSTAREEPRDIIITQSPVPTTQKKEEVTQTESAS